jgi:hypothetical protein
MQIKLPNKNTVILMVASVILMGCASSSINLSKARSVAEDKGIVFGRVKVIDDNMKIATLSRLLGNSIFSLILLPDGSSKGIYHPLHGEGYFYWHLPKGGYSIVGFEWMDNAYIKGRIFAHFNAPKDQTATYIGTLRISFAGDRYTFFIEDDYDFAITAFRKQYPEIKREFTRDLMRMEAQR